MARLGIRFGTEDYEQMTDLRWKFYDQVFSRNESTQWRTLVDVLGALLGVKFRVPDEVPKQELDWDELRKYKEHMIPLSQMIAPEAFANAQQFILGMVTSEEEEWLTQLGIDGKLDEEFPSMPFHEIDEDDLKPIDLRTATPMEIAKAMGLKLEPIDTGWVSAFDLLFRLLRLEVRI